MGDQFAEDAAQAGGAGRKRGGCLILVWIRAWDWVSGEWLGRHEQNKNTTGAVCQGNHSRMIWYRGITSRFVRSGIRAMTPLTTVLTDGE